MLEPLGQGPTTDQLGHDEGLSVGAPHIVDLGDAGVGQPGERPGFSDQALLVVLGEAVVQHLERHPAIPLGIERLEQRARGPARHGAQHGVSPQPLGLGRNLEQRVEELLAHCGVAQGELRALGLHLLRIG